MNVCAFVKFTFPACLLVAASSFPAIKNRSSPTFRPSYFHSKKRGTLVTAEYTLSKVIRASDDKTWFKIGDRKIIINCEAAMKAGISLQKISKNNFDVYHDSIAVTLPHAQFFSLSIPPGKIQVAYQEIGTFRDAFTASEREQLVAQAEPQIRSLVSSLGILQRQKAMPLFLYNIFFRRLALPR